MKFNPFKTKPQKTRNKVRAHIQQIKEIHAEFDDLQVRFYKQGLDLMVSLIQEYQTHGTISPQQTRDMLNQVQTSLKTLKIELPPGLQEIKREIESDMSNLSLRV